MSYADVDVCFIIGRVFDDTGDNGANWSDILNAVKWAYQQGANVINMSLGGGSYSMTGAILYKNIVENGSIVVAASGNKGTSELTFPGTLNTHFLMFLYLRTSLWLLENLTQGRSTELLNLTSIAHFLLMFSWLLKHRIQTSSQVRSFLL